MERFYNAQRTFRNNLTGALANHSCAC